MQELLSRRESKGHGFRTESGGFRTLPVSVFITVFAGFGAVMWGRFAAAEETTRTPRERIVTVYRSKYADVDRTCEALHAAIETRGFSRKPILNINKSMAKHGVHMKRQVRVVQFGRSAYAYDILRGIPEASVLMPCAFGVYEGEDGKVYISDINRHLVGKMLGPAAEEVWGEKASRDLWDVLRDHAVELEPSGVRKVVQRPR